MKVDVERFVCIYIYIERERETDRQTDRQTEGDLKEENIPKFDEFIMKVDVERFGCNNLLRDFKSMKNVKIAMDI